MARLNYKNWYIQLIPLKSVDGNWQLELEKGEIVHTFTMARSMTLDQLKTLHMIGSMNMSRTK